LLPKFFDGKPNEISGKFNPTKDIILVLGKKCSDHYWLSTARSSSFFSQKTWASITNWIFRKTKFVGRNLVSCVADSFRDFQKHTPALREICQTSFGLAEVDIIISCFGVQNFQ
jgi:hypothetical protein